MENKNWIKAGEKTKEVLNYARKLAKPETPLLEIAEKTEEYAEKQKLKFAFPINLCIDDIAAHYCPIKGDDFIARGLLKIDLGISIEGCSGDSALTIDLTPEDKHKEIIKANQEALEKAIKLIKEDPEIRINMIGKIINESISSRGFQSIKNLSGHEITPYLLHSGVNIPNYDNQNQNNLEEGIYAIEPFATYGDGFVKDWKNSNILMLRQRQPVRGNAQKILKFIEEEYQTLPFSSRWILNKFGKSSILSLNQMEKQGVLHHFQQLVERSGREVSQFEHTVSISKGKVSVITE
ncbi:MAG: type II methionyl aminopeptidase [Nanoarchaeota archaeon]|nr:type II methionyl aminopeptidase [Nanoarchaeota archaeon]